MTNEFELNDSDETLSHGLKDKQRKIWIASLVLALLVSSGGGTYYYLYSSAKAGMSEGCIKNMQGIGEAFRSYQLSSHKPGLFDDASTTPSANYSTLSSKLGSMKSVLDENSFYPGAKKALKELEGFNENLDDYQYLKGKILKIELSNPALAQLSAWASFTRNNTYSFLTNPAGMKRVEQLGLKYERNWNDYMGKKVPKSDYIEMDNSVKLADEHYYQISELCRVIR